MHLISAIAAAVAAVLAAAYVAGVRRGGGSIPLAIAFLLAGLLELVDLQAVRFPERLEYWKTFSVWLEALIPPLWLAFSLTFSWDVPLRRRRIHLAAVAAAFCFPFFLLVVKPGSLFYSPDFASEGVLFLSDAAFWFYVSFLVLIVGALVSLEATLASASYGTRWKIKFQAIGAGAYLGVLILYYSHSLLYRTLDMRLVPVRALIFVLAAALVVYSRVFRGDGAKVAVSRGMAYRSLVLLAVGLYLVILGLLGEGFKYFGEPVQRGTLLLIGFLSGLALIVTLLSESLRRRAKVFILKNFYRQKYDYREQWLDFTNRLAAARDRFAVASAVLQGFAEILAMTRGEIFLLDDDGMYRSAAAFEGSPSGEVFSPESPLAKLLGSREWVLNCREDDAVIRDEAYFAENNPVFVVPLLQENLLQGMVMIGNPVDPKERYNFEDYDLMRTLARQASSAVLNLRLSEQLAQVRELEAVGRVSTFIVHDLKNLVYTISLVLDNARDYIADPEFQEDMLSSLENTVAKMKVLISRLKKVPERSELQQKPADLLDLARETVAMVSGGNISVSGSPVTVPVDREEIQKVVLNLLLNAVEATEGQGTILLEVGEEDAPFFRVTDDGCGMSEEFLRNELFVPFHSTKKKGLGIGLYQCKQIVEAHGGRIAVKTAPGEGAAFTVVLPPAAGL